MALGIWDAPGAGAIHPLCIAQTLIGSPAHVILHVPTIGSRTSWSSRQPKHARCCCYPSHRAARLASLIPLHHHSQALTLSEDSVRGDSNRRPRQAIDCPATAPSPQAGEDRKRDGLMVKVGKRTYTCRHCARVFKRSEHCARHERVHTQEKPFACAYCDRRYARKCVLCTRRPRPSEADRAVLTFLQRPC